MTIEDVFRSINIEIKCCEPFEVRDIIKQQQEIINHQQAEIEKLEKGSLKEAMTFNSNTIANVRAEAVKEFAERLKENKIDVDVSFGYGREVYTEAVPVIEIDNLVKEWQVRVDENYI